MVDLEKSEKLPPEHRYFNISVIWIFYFRWVLRILYVLRIPHELVTLLSIGLGLLSAYCFYWGHLIVAAIALHFKDVFDACDGALARLTGRGHLIGRYLDSLGDFVVLTLVMGAIALRAAETRTSLYYLWGALAILSTFIQCSFFNFYQLAYLDRFEIKTLSSKRDEVGRDDLELTAGRFPRRFVLTGLRLIYSLIYGWQDRFVAAVDNTLLKRCPENRRDSWYGHRSLMVAQSALCFGTHIFVVIVFALVGKPQLSLLFVLTIMNLYLILLLWYRRVHFGRLIQKTVAF
jgi:phosphatidylglycerophosphate synthase